jgi:hypothetical protein
MRLETWQVEKRSERVLGQKPVVVEETVTGHRIAQYRVLSRL